jgi:signal transduction histidine kinase
MFEGAATLSVDGTILYCNKSFAQLLSQPVEKTVGSNITTYLLEGENSKFGRLIKRAEKGRAKGSIAFVANSDQVVHLNLSMQCLSSEVGAEICVIATDITQDKKYRLHLESLVKSRTEAIQKAHELLKETQERLNVALENGNIGIWEWDTRTNNMNLDNRMKKIFRVDINSQPTFGAFEHCINEEDLDHFRKAIAATLRTGKQFETVVRTKPVNGISNYISLKALVNKNGKGRPAGLSGVCFDVTDMKKGTEKVLIKLNDELLRSNKDLEHFAYIASHDLQEPLRMVSFFSQKLGDKYREKLDQDAQDYIKFAVDGSKRMYYLINGLLEYSRINTKGKTFTSVDMNDVLRKVSNNLGLKIRERKVIITLNCNKLPTVYADENQMVQIMQNLIANGIKFSKGIPEITIGCETESSKYTFSVHDNGIGIEPQYYERIFRMFQRLVRSDEYEGIGVGLAICKRIIERHGGEIWLKSEPGKGTTFYFTILRENNESE